MKIADPVLVDTPTGREWLVPIYGVNPDNGKAYKIIAYARTIYDARIWVARHS